MAARLQGEAGPGEVLLTDEAYARVRDKLPGLERRDFNLKGKTVTTAGWVLSVGG